ncbi:MAG: hypothetical protein AAF664_12965 [Planctomycetota bacterium]
MLKPILARLKRLKKRTIAASCGILILGVAVTFWVWPSPPPPEELPPTADENLFRAIESFDVAAIEAEDPSQFSGIFHVPAGPVPAEGLLEFLSRSDMAETLTAVRIDGGLVEREIPRELLESLMSMPKLRELRFRQVAVTDSDLNVIARHKQLEILNFPDSICTTAGIEHLISMPTLRQLRLGSAHLTGESASKIRKLESLRSLHLIGIPIDDTQLRKLADLPLLESLYLDDCAVTQEGWIWLFEHHPHLHVHVDQVHHDRDPQLHRH